MATTFELRVSCERARAQVAERVLEAAHLLIARLERELSEFLPESGVHSLNSAAPLLPVPVSPSALELLERSERTRERTEGRFSCLAKSSPDALAALGAGTPLLAWDPSRGLAWRLHEGARVGFGAIGKGYALDQVRSLLEREGFRDFLLVAGGSSLVFSGFAAPGVPWSWGWSWGSDAEGSALGISFKHWSGETLAVGVSGTHEKGAHILDARTGDPVEGPLTALVAHPSAAEADALSTALFASGWDEGARILGTALVPPAAAVIGRNGIPRWNGLFQKEWGALAAVAALLGAKPALANDEAVVTENVDGEAVDLGDLGLNDFNPYSFDRQQGWIALPLLALALVALHLRKSRPPRRSPRSPQPVAEVPAHRKGDLS